MDKVELRIKKLLYGSNLTLCAAESCTGGRISHLITTIPGSSDYYLGSVTSYSPLIKQKLLGVSAATIEENGIVSSAVARAMAEGARKLTGADYSVATTGWADSYGDEHEPAGTCWVAVSGPRGTISEKLSHNEARISNIKAFATSALEILYDYIKKDLNN